MDKLISVFSSYFNELLPLLCIYIVIGAFSVVITVYDKKAAKKKKKENIGKVPVMYSFLRRCNPYAYHNESNTPQNTAQ